MIEKYKRPITDELHNRLTETVRRLQIIAGPRQVGKTTAIKQVLDSRPRDSFAFYATDDSDTQELNLFELTNTVTQPNAARDRDWLSRIWQHARDAASQWWHNENIRNPSVKPPAYTLVLDEIQNIDNWSSTVKGLWDADRSNHIPMHVVLLGSAPLLMQKGLSESLMGRFEVIQMNHWSYPEMRDAFGYSLEEYIYFGGYPGPAHWIREGNESRWRAELEDSLIKPNLFKDVLSLAKIEKPALLRQLFDVGCSVSGQIAAITKIQGQLQDAGNSTTLTHYLSLLREVGLLAGIDKYSADTIRRRASKPKWCVMNTAFISARSHKSFETARADTAFWGHIVESCVGAHLLNTSANGVKIAYWNDAAIEVDFVVHNGSELCALEVKSSKPKTGANKGLEAFRARYPRTKTILVRADDPHAFADFLSKPANLLLE